MAHPSDDIHDVAIVVYDDFMSLDAFGPLEVFNGANGVLIRKGLPAHYRPRLVSVDGRAPACSSGPSITTDGPLPSHDAMADTVIVSGGDGTLSPEATTPIIDWLADIEPGRLASVCSGALILAAAGRLDGKQATTLSLIHI